MELKSYSPVPVSFFGSNICMEGGLRKKMEPKADILSWNQVSEAASTWEWFPLWIHYCSACRDICSGDGHLHSLNSDFPSPSTHTSFPPLMFLEGFSFTKKITVIYPTINFLMVKKASNSRGKYKVQREGEEKLSWMWMEWCGNLQLSVHVGA